MPSTPPRICFRCGTHIPAGGTAYRCRVEMVADFDGYLDGDSEANSAAAGSAALGRAAEQTEEELNEQVYRERTVLCCVICAEAVWRQLTKPQAGSSLN